MTPSAAEHWDDTDARTIDLPATAATQRTLHEAIGHLYDELATACVEDEATDAVPDDVFEHIEALYVATAEESVSQIELTYELEE